MRHSIDCRFDEGHGAADGQVAGQRVSDAKGNANCMMPNDRVLAMVDCLAELS